MDPNENRYRINYLYFGVYFLLLSLLYASSVFTRENLSGSRFFFFLYTMGQVTLETALFIFLGWIIYRFLGKVWFALFVGGTFVWAIVHVLDFMINRVLDLSIWDALRIFVLDETFENFLFLLDASGIPLWAWLLFAISIMALPLIGIGLYKLSDLYAQKRPLAAKKEWFLQAFLCIPCAMFLWDYSASGVIHPNAYNAFIKSLPWKMTFLHPSTVSIALPGPIRAPKSEDEILHAIAKDKTVLSNKPNIYLFVMESLRDDFITTNTAPNLNRFKERAIHFDNALSGGNGTHLSWFSIFHSQFPYFWRETQQKNWKMGSPPLTLLKKWGYKIRVYTSAQLGYYGMEDLIFGKNHHLIDTYQQFPHAPPLNACDSDLAAMEALQKDLTDSDLQQGQVCIVFLDGTHFAYSWPSHWKAKFIPFAKELAYFRTINSATNREMIKNRYRNSIHYMDSLFHPFFKNLPNKQESIIAILGDHGEEFFEHGHLFHNSHLSREQTRPPLYLKLGNSNRTISNRNIVSQIDIFPSIIDHLSNKSVDFLEGQSIFSENRWPFAITARFNAGHTPYEFSIHNGKTKIIAQFPNRTNIFAAETLRIMSIRDNKDRAIHQTDALGFISTEFGPAFDRLFHTIEK